MKSIREALINISASRGTWMWCHFQARKRLEMKPPKNRASWVAC
jgi:hypothetical protein